MTFQSISPFGGDFHSSQGLELLGWDYQMMNPFLCDSNELPSL